MRGLSAIVLALLATSAIADPRPVRFGPTTRHPAPVQLDSTISRAPLHGPWFGMTERRRIARIVPPIARPSTYWLAPRDIDAVIRANAGVFRGCYQRRLDARTDRRPIAGSLALRFVIAADGRVRSVAIATDTLGDAEVAACVERRILQLQFPGGTGAIVTYPFGFSSS